VGGLPPSEPVTGEGDGTAGIGYALRLALSIVPATVAATVFSI